MAKHYTMERPRRTARDRGGELRGFRRANAGLGDFRPSFRGNSCTNPSSAMGADNSLH
jgi:hypothetical protein